MTLVIPPELPDGTVITLSIRAVGDFISAAEFDPVWLAVAQKRKEEDKEEEEVFTCAFPPTHWCGPSR